MKIFVLASVYPMLDDVGRPMYIHTRNKCYKDHGADVTVLNFASNKDYVIDNIKVISANTFFKYKDEYSFDVLVSHAPNIRNHYRFIKKYEHLFPKMVFVFHGHEVLRVSTVYPKPFFWKKRSLTRVWLRNCYDTFKLRTWKRFFSKKAYKSHFVFVSRWMYEEFIKNTNINPEVIQDRYSIIYNGVGTKFEKLSYSNNGKKQYDFITIRQNIDGEKYAIDIVNDLAKNNPKLKFLVIGKGEIFDHVDKASNLVWENRNLNHDELLIKLDSARCGLMPTRTDAQGLLMCEMATYGIPVITSNIPVCLEVFGDFKNVAYIDNEDTKIDLKSILDKLCKNVPYEKNSKYFMENTSYQEFKLLKRLI